ncbi:hypothetical protein FRC12_017946 [Ceratobasidium sp. 428]|nr:hypothetical protein FRC12_017946 [Ceratobasidium sp. 428]
MTFVYRVIKFCDRLYGLDRSPTGPYGTAMTVLFAGQDERPSKADGVHHQSPPVSVITLQSAVTDPNQHVQVRPEPCPQRNTTAIRAKNMPKSNLASFCSGDKELLDFSIG